jgi:hypothetical protein
MTQTALRLHFRPVLVLLTLFLGVSVAMLAALAVLTATGSPQDIAIWIRCSFVLASSVLLLLFAVSAARGSRAAWIRLRIVAPIVVVAVIVIVAIPGFLPDWVRLEQALCGALVLPVAILANLPRARALYARKA